MPPAIPPPAIPTPTIPTLETARLRLRGPVLGDHAASLAMWSTPAVARHITGRPNTAEECWARLLRYAGHWALLGFGYWVVERRADGAYLGELGLSDYHRDLTPSMSGLPEIGWVLTTAAHGQGYATEAATVALAWRDRALPPGPTACIIAPENAASLRVAARLGFHEIARPSYKGEPTVMLHRPFPELIPAAASI